MDSGVEARTAEYLAELFISSSTLGQCWARESLWLSPLHSNLSSLLHVLSLNVSLSKDYCLSVDSTIYLYLDFVFP